MELSQGSPAPPAASPAAPASPEAAAEAARPPRKKFQVDIYRAWCKSCGLCAAFCQKKVLERDLKGAPVVAHPERCIGCRWCEVHCPDFAIHVEELDGPAEAAPEAPPQGAA